MKGITAALILVGGLGVFTIVTFPVLSVTTDVMVSTALGPVGLCPDFYPFYAEGINFYIEQRDIRPVLGIDYPGFESKEDFQARRYLYMLEHDKRLNPNRLSIATQSSIIFVAKSIACGIILYGLKAFIDYRWPL
jgi:hypothetical protein